MNSMNITAPSFSGKLPASRIKLARNINNKELPVDNYVKEMLEEHGSKVEKIADYLGRDIVIAQKGKLLLANSGGKTTAINMEKENMIDGMIHNLKINASENYTK